MAQAYQWRRQYIELVEDLFRELGFVPPAMTHDPDLPLAMELEVNELTFEIVHTPTAQPHQVLVECRFGTVPEPQAEEAYIHLLRHNLDQARHFHPAYGIEAQGNNVICAFHESLEQASARGLLDSMGKVAEQGKHWRNNYRLEASPELHQGGAKLFETLA